MSQNSKNFNTAQKNAGIFRTYAVVGEFKYAIGIFQGAKGVTMATKFKQK